MSRAKSLYTDWDIYDGGWLDYDKTTAPMMKEILECFVGPLISEGTTRSVFACKYDPGVVLKFQKSYGQQNALEVHVWERYRDVPEVAKWLAPVVGRSSSNRVILQRRTAPMHRAPKKLPGFLNDRKVQNYGMLDGRVVCHDYGLLTLIETKNIKMEPVQWWDGSTNKDYSDGDR